MDVAKLQIAAMNNDCNGDNEQISLITSIKLERVGIFEYSLHHIRMVIFANIMCFFIYCGRTSIWVPYVTETSTFAPDPDITMIAFVVWIECIILSMMGFVFCIFGQIVGYDKCMTLLTLIILAGCIVEYVANSFSILAIGYLISQSSFLMIYITTSYISWCLPFETAIIYISYNYATSILFGFSGSLYSSFIAYLISYKIAFIISTTLMSIIFLMTLTLIFGKQKKLQNDQFEIEQLYEMHHQHSKYQQTLTLPMIPLRSSSPRIPSPGNPSPHHKQEQVRRGGMKKHQLFPVFLQELVRRSNDDDANKKLFDLNISPRFERYLLFHYVMQIGLLYGTICAFYIYYTQYMLEKYTEESSSQIMAGLHAFSCGIAGAWGIIMARFIVLRLSFKFERRFILIGLCIKFGIFEFAFIQTTELYLNFVWCSLSMFIAGALLLVFEKLLLEIQTFPKETGKINGIKCIVSNVMRATCVFITGILWKRSVESFFHGLAVMIAIMVLLEMVYMILINGTLKRQMRLRNNNRSHRTKKMKQVHVVIDLKATPYPSKIITTPSHSDQSQFEANFNLEMGDKNKIPSFTLN